MGSELIEPHDILALSEAAGCSGDHPPEPTGAWDSWGGLRGRIGEPRHSVTVVVGYVTGSPGLTVRTYDVTARITD